MNRGGSLTAQVRPAAEAGYALVAAVAAILFFATVALAALTLTRRVIVTGAAEVEAARASAAAEAGIALALRGLLATDATNAFPVDGTPRRLIFDGSSLEIVVRDERGKVPLNLIDETQLVALLEFAGLSGEPLQVARHSFLDWIDDDDEARTRGAERAFYRKEGLAPRNAPLQTLREVGRIRGFPPDVFAKIASIATTDFGNGTFDLQTATPAAIAIMYPAGDAAVDEIIRRRQGNGQVTSLNFADRASRVARPITILATATDPSGAVATRSCVVELTGAIRRPYLIRYCA